MRLVSRAPSPSPTSPVSPRSSTVVVDGCLEIRARGTKADVSSYRVRALQEVSLVLALRLARVGTRTSADRLSLAPHYEEAATELKGKDIKLAKVRLALDDFSHTLLTRSGGLHGRAELVPGVRCQRLPHAQGLPKRCPDRLHWPAKGGRHCQLHGQVSRFLPRWALLMDQAIPPRRHRRYAFFPRRVCQV